MKMQRLYEIIKILIEQNDFITIQNLSKMLHVSPRTIHSDLSSQDFLNIIAPATLIKKPNKGIRIELDWQTKLQILSKIKTSIHLNDEKESDFCKIMLRLLSEKDNISGEDFCNDLYISNSTFYALMQKVENFVKQYHCQIIHKKRKGYSLLGDENEIRKLFFDFMTSFIKDDSLSPYQRISDKTFSMLNVFFYDNEIKKLVDIVNISENIMNTNYVDEDYNRLLVQLSIQMIRLKMNHHILDTNHQKVTSTQEYYYATLMKTYLEKEMNIIFSDYEIEYMTLLLIGTRKQKNMNFPQQNMEVLEKFINLLSIRLNIELSNDFELKQNLINHLKPAIYRMKYGMISENPMLEQIRMNYTEIYMAVITTIEDLEYMENIFFDSNEIGYICLHIIAAINRPTNKKKIKTALICNEGLSIEIFLKNLIESYFNEMVIDDIFRENTIKDLDTSTYDLILNTTTHDIESHHVLKISTNFTQKDHSIIRHFLMYHSHDIVAIENLYQNYLLFFQDTLASAEELLKKYCQFLLEKNYTKDGFYESVIQRMHTSSTYVARGIALPHGAKNKVINSIILMINLKHSIKWDNEDTDFVILVAANDADAKSYSYLFRKIMKIASIDEYSHDLKKCTNINELKLLLEKV